MKKIFFSLLVILPIFMFAFNANGVFEVTNKTDESVSFSFSLPQIDELTTSIDGTSYSKLYNPAAATTLEKGKPELLFFSTMIALPNTGSYKIETRFGEDKTFNLKNKIYPAQGNEIYDGFEKQEFVIDNEFYQKPYAFINQKAIASKPFVMRDLRLVSVNVYPFTYKNGELVAAKTANITITFTDEAGENELNYSSNKISKYFDNIYRSTVLNYSRNTRTEFAQPNLLVVHNEASLTNIADPLEFYVKWKEQKGFNVTVIGPNEYGSDSNTNIKNYIQGLWNSDNRPDFIVLFGDPTDGVSQVPTFMHSFASTRYNGEGDSPYSYLAGSDDVPDVPVGRISGETRTELLTIVKKAVKYEVRPNTEGQQNHLLLVGDESHSGISTTMLNKYVKEWFAEYNNDSYFTEVYGQAPAPSALNAAINSANGIGWFNYRGWIGMDGWANQNHGSLLTNDNKTFNGVIPTCSTGNFNGDAVTEKIIKVGSPTTPKGAVNGIGLSTSGTHTAFNNCLAYGFWDSFFQGESRSIGEGVFLGEINLWVHYGQSNPSKAKTFTHIWNLMGDTSQEVFFKDPQLLTVTHDTLIPNGSNSMTINVQQTDTNANLAGAWVTIWSATDGILATDYTDFYGNVTLTFDGSYTGDVKLTVTKPEFKPYQTNVTINNANAMVLDTVEIDDNNSGASQGNDNNSVNPGEIVELFVGIKSTEAIGTHTGVTATISSADDAITITSNTSAYPTLTANGTALNNDAFVVQVNSGVYNNQKVLCNLEITDDANNTFNQKFFIEIKASDIDVVNTLSSDGDNLNPGEEGVLKITLTNKGSNDCAALTATLTVDDYRIDVVDNSATYAAIAVDAEVAPALDNFIIDISNQLLPGQMIPAKLELTDNNGFEEEIEFVINIGNPVSTDPLGPDAYGYICYDDTDTAYLEAPTYNWIEIDPRQGGDGVDTGLDDDTSNTYHTLDDAKFVDVDLPINFSFYGETYNVINIGSDGWISFGENEMAVQRNWRIPGPGGPRPLVAVFWDNLYNRGTTGKVYTKHDAEDNVFIVQWSEMKNDKDNSSEETFQVILYDNIAYPTSTMDSSIKMQYKVFNNVDEESPGSNSHGNYCTIGIENNDETIGLEYTYNNQYPTAASPLGNQRAILFTPLPIASDDAYLVAQDVIIQNESGFAYPEILTNLGLKLSNIGNSPATNATITVTSTHPEVEIVSGTSTYPLIEGDDDAFNNTPISFRLGNGVTDGEVIPFNVFVENGNMNWNYPISVTAKVKQAVVSSMYINDSIGNNNGVVNPNENFVAAMSFKNTTGFDIEHLYLTATTTTPNVSFAQNYTNFDLGRVNNNESIQIPLELTTTADFVQDTRIAINVVLTDVAAQRSELLNTTYEFVSTATPSLMDTSFDSWLDEGWHFGENPDHWHQNNTAIAGGTAPEARLNWAPAMSSGRTELISPVVEGFSGANPKITFKHELDHYSQTNTYSVKVDYRVNGGAWVNIWQVTPSGNIADEIVTIDLDEAIFASGPVEFCWALEGNSNNINNWYLDDLALTAEFGNSAQIKGNITIADGPLAAANATVNVSGLYVHPATNGDYTIYAPAVSYDAITATAPYYSTSSSSAIDLTFGQVLENNDFTLYYLFPATNLAVAENGENLELTWEATATTNVNFTQYKVYRRTNVSEFELVGTSTTTSFTDSDVENSNRYYYYVVAEYAEGLSEQTPVINHYLNNAILYGDVDQNGEITADDVGLVANAIVELAELTEEQALLADVYDDDVVTAFDASLIAMKYTGELELFPVMDENYVAPVATVNITAEHIGQNNYFLVFTATSGNVLSAQIDINDTSLNIGTATSGLSNVFSLTNTTDSAIKYVVFRSSAEASASNEVLRIPIQLSAEATFNVTYIVNAADAVTTEYTITSTDNNAPVVTSLKGNYPNPFNPTTTFEFANSKNQEVSLKIYNVKGQLVKTLVNKKLNQGSHKITWNGKADSGKSVGSGVYFYRLKAGKFVETKKAILLK